MGKAERRMEAGVISGGGASVSMSRIRCSEVIVPSGVPQEQWRTRTTALGVVAHPDDLEIAAYHGILGATRNKAEGFAGVVVTHGGGSPRSGGLANSTDQQLAELRRKEQEDAARIGGYEAVVWLDYDSAEVKGTDREALVGDLEAALLDFCIGTGNIDPQ